MNKASQYKFTKEDGESVQSYGQFQFDEQDKVYKFEKGGTGFIYSSRQVSASVQPVSRGLGTSAHVKNRPLVVQNQAASGDAVNEAKHVRTTGTEQKPDSHDTNRLSLNSSRKQENQLDGHPRSVDVNANDSGYFQQNSKPDNDKFGYLD